MVNFSPSVNLIIKALRAAGRHLIRDYGELESLQSSQKPISRFVETSIKKSEEIFIEQINQAKKNYSILLNNKVISKGDGSFAFHIDSVDGVVNFAHALPFFSLNVHIEKIETQEIVATVIYSPILGEIYIAEKGSGAWMEKINGGIGTQSQRMRISARKKLGDAIIMIGNEFHPEIKKFVTLIRKNGLEYRMISSQSLAGCYFGLGRSDIYIFDDYKMQLILKEAGSLIFDEQGHTISDTSKVFFAGNDHICKEFFSIISQEKK